MPAPAVYVLAIVGTVAAGIAFKEFVYEPHIAPRLEKWAEEFIAKRKARRKQRESPIAVAASIPSKGKARSKRSDDGGDTDDDDKSTYELEKLISHEVHEWRNEVDKSNSSTLRLRRNAASEQSALDQSNIAIPYPALIPTHVIFNSSTLSTPTTVTDISRASASPTSSPLPHTLPEIHLTSSRSTLRSPSPTSPPGRLPTPAPSVALSPQIASDQPFPPLAFSPSSIPSLSLSHPVDLDQEHGVELLSAPSSRPDTPFSNVSNREYHSFSPALHVEYLVLSDGSDHDAVASVASSESSVSEFDEQDSDELCSNFGSEISMSSWASVGSRARSP
ncbi:uncharacterized protein BT62DRAFT_678230 [Guyanagaster necrorhizus]|uniref:Uncharacterized protein n=1 Tax=Guyanagaster necrorhizus TaxID=856835 RepID=A0A9P7VZU6_9AGAR|nr:uncharacterized protein BT62DRAFT_678230 [Guyanagaster necrorhizus MCA 3950]KAG7449339.1 hypothetical protein BT62DRAFT_678230 [Guyanagaster necrorhizus MCA 3950]